VLEQSKHGTVTIGAVEKHITDTAWERGWVKPVKPDVELALSVGIVGAGPGGMAAAEELRKLGYQVTIYDRYDRAGGLMIYGIPGFKLEKYVVERRTKLLEQSGVKFVLGVNVGTDISFADLRKKHDSILIATGVYKARALAVPGVGANGVFPAMTYLTASNRLDLGDKVADFENGKLNANGKNVVVIGGGDTAMDCVRTAIRQGAKSVKCLYRRDRENMPGSQREVTNAIEEGVEFLWLSAPEAVLHDADQQATGVRAVRMRLGTPDTSGRAKPEVIEDSQFVAPAEMVIEALGFDPEDLSAMFGEPGLGLTRWGTLKTDFRTAMTTMDGVFAAGDIVRGASLVVWAIRDGRDAAASIHTYLQSPRASATEALKKAS
jgi:glutamate synthase (NADPH/NADH) small chain